MADFRFFYQFDLIAAINRHDFRYISKALSCMAETNQSLSPKILKALANAIDPDQLRKDGRKKNHFYFCDPFETKIIDHDLALDYIFLCDSHNRELARFIVHSDDPITPPCRSINVFDKKKYRKKDFPSRGNIKDRLCELYGMSLRSFDTYLSEHRKAEEKAFKDSERMMEEMLGKPYSEFCTEYIAGYRKEHGENIDRDDRMMDEFYEDFDIISRHFWPEDWPTDES